MLRIAFKYIQATFNNSLHILRESERESERQREERERAIDDKGRHKVI
jgi:hypothetical protein